MATCISLQNSTTCSAFNVSSISTTDTTVVGYYPFLKNVHNVDEFDRQLTAYANNAYVQQQYASRIGCTAVNLTDTSDYYARYTISVICNGIVQNSKIPCGLTESQSPPLCATTCASYATSEEEIAINRQTCATTLPTYMDQIRADFIVCSMPADSLTGLCITGEMNERENCGYSSNLPGLCSYCASSSPNATDSCCINSKASTRCSNVDIPSTSSIPPLFTVTAMATTTPDSVGNSSGSHLSGGQIAGVVVGSVAGIAILAGLIMFLLFCLRRRRNSANSDVFNKPTPKRSNQPMQMAPVVAAQRSLEPVPGGRVARMSALQAEVDDSDRGASRGMFAAAGKYSDTSDSEGLVSSPESRSRRRAPVAGRRQGSLSSTSVLGMDADSSPLSGTAGQFSSPDGVASGQSEQLPYFRDYYSQDDIHPNDKVSVLWAYQPRAADEFDLDRGDMLKIVGIWDDGWATGVRINDRAEDFEDEHNVQRDSGVSNGSQARRNSSPQPRGEIKAFPLVCVCLPHHWRKIIDGDIVQAGSP
uniref:Rho guanine nucleotide exchange factor 5 n=1 Tax=Talaromyces marneffei PM1 TaxID=1077442 RepID=A0A093VF94_TALMA